MEGAPMESISSSSRSRVRRGTLWFGVLGGAIAWTIHLLAAYALAEFGCVSGLGQRGAYGISYVAWAVLVMTIAVTAVALLATVIAGRAWRTFANDLRPNGPAAAGEQYLAQAGTLMSGLFTVAILFETIPILYYLRTC
jgi:hypothetical protein